MQNSLCVMIALAFSLVLGCNTVSRFVPAGTERLPDLRGVPIMIEDTPENVLNAYRRRSDKPVRSVEKCDDGKQFRIENTDGGIFHLNADGRIHGGVI